MMNSLGKRSSMNSKQKQLSLSLFLSLLRSFSLSYLTACHIQILADQSRSQVEKKGWMFNG